MKKNISIFFYPVLLIFILHTAVFGQKQGKIFQDGSRVEKITSELKERLSLTDEQGKKLKEIVAAGMEEMQSRMKDVSADHEQRIKIRAEGMKELDKKIEKLLTSAQKKEYEKYKKERQQRLRQQRSQRSG